MSIQVAIKKNDEKPHWISLEEFKKLLFEEEVSTKGLPQAYPLRVENFFDQIAHNEMVSSVWREAYPNVDIESELKLAKAWLLSNTGSARKDFKKFCNNWLAKAMRNSKKTAVVKDRHQQSDEELKKKRQSWNRETPASQDEIKEILKEYL